MKTWAFTKINKQTLFDISILLVSLALVASSMLTIWLNLAKFPIAVPLWFSETWGKSWLAEPSYLWIIPSINFIVIIINLSIAKIVESEEKIAHFLLNTTSLIVSILLFYTLLEIIFVST